MAKQPDRFERMTLKPVYYPGEVEQLLRQYHQEMVEALSAMTIQPGMLTNYVEYRTAYNNAIQDAIAKLKELSQ